MVNRSDTPYTVSAHPPMQPAPAPATTPMSREEILLARRTCGECGKVVCRPSDLPRHELTHSGLRAHVCTWCDKAFTQKSALNTHMNIHTGNTPYACSFCSMRFRDPSVRSRHLEEQHRQSKDPYLCEYCPKYDSKGSPKKLPVFKRKDVLRKHLKNKHGINPPSSSTFQRVRAGAGASHRRPSARHGSVRRRRSSFERDTHYSATSAPFMSAIRPTRRAAQRANQALSSIIELEDHHLDTIPDESDASDSSDEYITMSDVESEDAEMDMEPAPRLPPPPAVPIFSPSYTPSVQTPSASSSSSVSSPSSSHRLSISPRPIEGRLRSASPPPAYVPLNFKTGGSGRSSAPSPTPSFIRSGAGAFDLSPCSTTFHDAHGVRTNLEGSVRAPSKLSISIPSTSSDVAHPRFSMSSLFADLPLDALGSTGFNSRLSYAGPHYPPGYTVAEGGHGISPWLIYETSEGLDNHELHSMGLHETKFSDLLAEFSS